MGWFVFGLLTGWFSSLLVGAGLYALARQRMARLQRRAEQAERLAQIGTLTGGLAHEIKNPLSTVQLNLQLLQEDLMPENPAYHRIIGRLNTVQRETTRLKDILEDFLRYAGKLELDRASVDLTALLEELVDFFAPQAQLNHVRLHLKPATEQVLAPVDVRLLKQAVLNLMINGVQAMGNGGGELIVSAARDGREATIDVIDTGQGMSSEVQGRIFDAYYSTKKGGSGLGLAMSRRIVEEHGGRITVQSEPGKGSNFRIHLPLQP